MNLVNKGAALLVKDNEAKEKLVSTVVALAQNEHLQTTLHEKIREIMIKNADELIAKEVLKVMYE
jgi:UDP-N-acetylglucosamine--N-acetylmuramyl-(pentapeptide) pyrophosphoryl-undecaprenol N-acetylglucosamine transferase